MPIFDAWDEQDAQQAIDDELHPLTGTNREFMAGRHWMDGDGWVGPRPRQSDEGYQETIDEIRRAFTSRNVILEGVSRHVHAVIGREPLWALTPRRAMKANEQATAEEQRLIDEAEAALTTWWNERKIHAALKTIAARSLWAERGLLRFFVPAGLLSVRVDEEGRVVRTVEARTLEDALTKVYPDTPEPDQSVVTTDLDTMRQAGIVISERENDETVVDMTYLEDAPVVLRRARDVAQANTVLRRIVGEVEQRVSLPLGGRLTMYEVRRPLLVTEQIQENQRSLNLALSMVPRNVITGGFLERVLLNAQMPGEWEVNQETGEKIRFKPAQFVTGAGTTNFVSGVDYQDEDGKTHLSDPNVVWREPSPVDSPVKATSHHYHMMLGEFKQEHILISGDATASGTSREQARADFEKSLETTQEPIEAAGRWVLETALAMAEAFIGAPGKYTNVLRATFDCRIETGPISPDEQTKVGEQVEKGLIARETGMQRIGVADVDAEMAKIESQPSGQLELRAKRAELLVTLLEKMEPEQAAKLAGYGDEEIALIKAGAKKDPVPAVAGNISRPAGSGNGTGAGAARPRVTRPARAS